MGKLETVIKMDDPRTALFASAGFSDAVKLVKVMNVMKQTPGALGGSATRWCRWSRRGACCRWRRWG